MLNERTSWLLAGFTALCTGSVVLAQGGLTCAEAASAVTGDNAYDNSGGVEDIDYTGFCDMGPFGDDMNHKAVWFMWTATATDTFTVSTCNTAGGVDTRLSVQTACTSDTVVACNDDGAGCANFSSLLTFSATEGTVYYIALGVYNAATTGGPGTMAITQGDGGGGGGGGGGDCCVANPGTTCCSDQTCCDTVCAADPYCCDTEWDQFCADAAVAMCEACGGGGGGGGCGAGGDCCVANPGTTGCVDTDCCNSVCAADAFCCNTEWDQICADEAAALCSACGAGSCDVPAGDQVEQEVCGDDSNGGCNGGGANEALASLNGSVGGTFYATTALRDTDWFTFTVSSGTELTLSLYSPLPSFCAIVENPGCTIVGSVSTGSCPSTLTACIGPGDYYIVCLPSQFLDFPCGGALGNDYTLQVSSVACEWTPPAGDNCEAPTTAVIGSNDFDNTTAGTQFGEPTCGFGGAAFTKDVFFSFTVTAADDYTFQTCDAASTFDTGIEIWTACPADGGSMLACNDDGPGCPTYSSLLASYLDVGTYIIRVGGWQGATGASTLNISQGAPVGPENDNCAKATPAVLGSNAFDTVGSTTDGPNPTDASCGAAGGGFYNDVWFDFTSATATTILVSTCGGAAFDTRIDIYADCNFGVPVACSDDNCALQTEVSFAATAGATYKIRIGAYGAAGFGAGTFTITDAGGGGGGGGEGLSCENPLVLAMGTNAFDRAGATVDLDFAGFCDMGPFGTDTNFNCIFYTFSPEQSGLYTFSTCNLATHDTRLSIQTSCDVSSVVACNDDGDGCASFTSVMTAQLECGVDYIVALGGYSASTPTGTGELLVSVDGGEPCGTPCPADLDNDGQVGGSDLTIVLSAWGTDGADLDGDGTTGGSDLTIVLSAWGACP